MHHHGHLTHDEEEDTLLTGDNAQQRPRRFSHPLTRWKAHPFWYVRPSTRRATSVHLGRCRLIPVILVFSMSVGIFNLVINVCALTGTRSEVLQLHQGFRFTRLSRAGPSVVTRQTSVTLLTCRAVAALMYRLGQQRYKQVCYSVFTQVYVSLSTLVYVRRRHLHECTECHLNRFLESTGGCPRSKTHSHHLHLRRSRHVRPVPCFNRLKLIVFHTREAVFVLVMRSGSFFGRNAEQLIYVGPVVEGFVGGLSTFNGVVHAFVFRSFLK